MKLKSSRFLHSMKLEIESLKRERQFLAIEVTRKAITAGAVMFILSAIAASTLLALRQTQQQNAALKTSQESGRLKNDLDRVQQMMFDENADLYTLIGTRPLYQRPAYIFPLPDLLYRTRDARAGCNAKPNCLSRLDTLDAMIRKLAERSNSLARLAEQQPVGLGDPKLSEIDAYFYSVLERVVDARVRADLTIDAAVTKSSSSTKWVSYALLAFGATAAVLLLALIRWKARIAQRLRTALHAADSARVKYQRFFHEHPLPIWIFDDASLDIVAVNVAAQLAYGYSEAELLGMSLRDMRPSHEVARMDEAIDVSRKSGRGETRSVGVWLHQTSSGEHRSMDVYHLSIEFEGRPCTMSVMVDVTVETTTQAELFKSKQTLEYILDHIPQGIAWKDADHRYVGGNEIYARDAGLPSRHALIGLNDRDLHWGDDPLGVHDEDVRVMRGKLTKNHFERQTITADGSEVWISETKLPLKDQSDTVTGVLIAYENITARRNAELVLRLQSRAIDASINGIIIAELQPDRHVVILANAAVERITGYTMNDLVGIDCDTLFAMAGEAQKWTGVRHAMDTNTEANVTLLCTRKDSERVWVNVLVAPVRDERANVTHHVCVMSDVSALVEYQARLQHQASYDGLTELPNRALLDEHLPEAIRRAAASGGQASVLFLDLDRFKEVNDSLGHRVGDALLTSMARRLQGLVRPTDLVARYGGDEFIIVAERPDGETLETMLDSMIIAMTEPFHTSEQELYVEVSIGISTYPPDGNDADTLIRNADTAMYLAKARGRNGYQFYRPELNRVAGEKLQLSTRLKRAVKSEVLQVVYQPQVDLVTGHLVGAEALLRWNDPELGAVSPAVFVPIAEETGVILSMGEWVLRTACKQARRWRDEGLPPIRVSVNVSPVQLERSDLVEVVRSTLRETGWPAELLELELTEGALMRNADDAARVLRDLRELGVKVAIDDFGTGYSSLSYLKRFSIDRIKIDRAFIQEIGRDSEYEALTLAIIAIANAMKFDVIAEGVSLENQRLFLIAHGCVEGQGFLYSEAVSGDAIANMHRTPVRPAGDTQHLPSVSICA